MSKRISSTPSSRLLQPIGVPTVCSDKENHAHRCQGELHCLEEFLLLDNDGLDSPLPTYTRSGDQPSNMPHQPLPPAHRQPTHLMLASAGSFSAERRKLHRMSLGYRQQPVVGAQASAVAGTSSRRSIGSGYVQGNHSHHHHLHPHSNNHYQHYSTLPHPPRRYSLAPDLLLQRGGQALSAASNPFHQSARVLNPIDINSASGLVGNGGTRTTSSSWATTPLGLPMLSQGRELPQQSSAWLPPAGVQQQQQQLPQQQHHLSAQGRKRRSTANSTAAPTVVNYEVMARRLNTTEYPQLRQSVRTKQDKAVHHDPRAINALFEMEDQLTANRANAGEWRTKQIYISEAARGEAVEALREICASENADWNTFPLAVSYLDRVLSAQQFPTRNLYGLTGAALLLASKMKATQPIEPQRIVDLFTAASQRGKAHIEPADPTTASLAITLDQVLVTEYYVAHKLEWDLSTSTAYEFFDQLMVRAPILESLRSQFHHTVQAAMKDLELSTLPPSQQAALCLLHCAHASEHPYYVQESEDMIRHCYPPSIDESLLGNGAELHRLFTRLDSAMGIRATVAENREAVMEEHGETASATMSRSASSSSVPPHKRRLLLEEEEDETDDAESPTPVVEAASAPAMEMSSAPASASSSSDEANEEVIIILEQQHDNVQTALGCITGPSAGGEGKTKGNNDSGFTSEVTTPDELCTSTTQTTPVTTTVISTIVGSSAIHGVSAALMPALLHCSQATASSSLKQPVIVYNGGLDSAGTSARGALSFPGPSRPLFNRHQGFGPLFQINDGDEDEGIVDDPMIPPS